MKTRKEKTEEIGEGKSKKMTRKEAISKAGFMAISAATTMMLLSTPNKTHAGSAAPQDAPSDSGGEWLRRTAP